MLCLPIVGCKLIFNFEQIKLLVFFSEKIRVLSSFYGMDDPKTMCTNVTSTNLVPMPTVQFAPLSRDRFKISISNNLI